MKNIWFVILLALGIASACSSTQKTSGPNQSVNVMSRDSLEYELIILDPKYESFIAMQPSAEFYSQTYYENWNRQYVIEWNMRHRNPTNFGDFYQTEIDYDGFTDYGLELNYRLYYYFRFIEKEYNIRLISRGR
jgi:hypothetical protein